MKRQNIASGAPWEDIAAYSRAVKVGNVIYVSGTTGTDGAGKVTGDAYSQATQTIKNIAFALEQTGANLEHVVRTRIFITNIDDWQDVSRAHREAFDTIRPATTLLQVAGLIDPTMLVEIEAEAVISEA